MTISTYAQLQSTVSWYANRDDLFANITNFSPAAIDSACQIAIAMAENRLDRDINSRGGVKYAETVTNALVTVPNTEIITLPADFRSASAFMLTTDPFQVLTVRAAVDLFSLYTSASITGKPESYAVVGTNTAYIRPVPDGAYSTRLIYKAYMPPLSVSNASNWLLVNGLQLYIDAAMVELCVMFENDDRLQVWQTKYESDMDDFMGDDRQTRWTTVSMTPRPVGAIA